MELWLDQAANSETPLTAVHWDTTSLHDRNSLFDMLNSTVIDTVRLKVLPTGWQSRELFLQLCFISRKM